MGSRSERRAALRATHPDLGGDVDDFIAVLRAFDRTTLSPTTAAAPARGSGAAARVSRPTVTTTRRSRAARSLRRARRRLHSYSHGHRYAHLPEERP